MEKAAGRGSGIVTRWEQDPVGAGLRKHRKQVTLLPPLETWGQGKEPGAKGPIMCDSICRKLARQANPSSMVGARSQEGWDEWGGTTYWEEGSPFGVMKCSGAKWRRWLHSVLKVISAAELYTFKWLQG